MSLGLLGILWFVDEFILLIMHAIFKWLLSIWLVADGCWAEEVKEDESSGGERGGGGTDFAHTRYSTTTVGELDSLHTLVCSSTG